MATATHGEVPHAQEQEQSTTVFVLDEQSVLVPSIAFVLDKVQKHNQGKFSNLARYSREGFIEFLLETGINTVSNAVDADIKRRNEAAYVDAMSKLVAPTDDEDPVALQSYMRSVKALKRKYGIGGDKQTV